MNLKNCIYNNKNYPAFVYFNVTLIYVKVERNKWK